MRHRSNMKHHVVVAALVCTSVAFADRPAPERTYTITSPNGRYEFAMHPAVHEGGSATAPYGEAFEAPLDGGPLEDAGPLWRVDGWYSHETFISDDGRALVRIGPWASEDPADELAIAFYLDGRETRRYSVAELLDDRDAVQRSVSHYTWQKREQGYPQLADNSRFELLTVEDRVISFDIGSGEVRDAHTDQDLPPASVQVTREDADDLFFASNLFSENGMDIDERTIGRVVRGRVAVVWVSATFEGLPVFFHDIGYRFDNRRRMVTDPDTDKPKVWGQPLPPSGAFPIDHRADITPEEAVQVWLDRARSDEFSSADYEPRSEPETTLGFHNLRLGMSGDPVYRLAWRVRPRGTKYPSAMIDAKKGNVLFFDSGVRTGGALPEPAPSPGDRFVGTWEAAPCEQRRYRRELTLHANGEFAATDYVAPCPPDATCFWSGIVTHSGTWRAANAHIIEIHSTSAASRRGEPMPAAMGFDPRSGRLHEATPGATVLCEYRRVGESPAPPEPGGAGDTAVCYQAVQGRIAWDYAGSMRWQDANVRRLCAGREGSTEPAHCFDTAMHGSAQRDSSSGWNWRYALDLCAGTPDADAPILCFENEVARGKEWRDAIASCRSIE